MRKLQVSLVAIGLMSAPTFAADTANEKPKADPDKIVCKVDRTTGSSISERICKKRSVWDAEREAAKRLLDQNTRQNFDPNSMPSRGGG